MQLGLAMTKKTISRNNKSTRRQQTGSGSNLLLTLTLVPLIIGVLLIGAWVLEIDVFDDPQLQVTVGILFFLLSFAASNVLQKRWRLAAGWGLLICADLIILVWLHVWAQSVAILVGLFGLVLLGVEFYRQYQLGRVEKANK